MRSASVIKLLVKVITTCKKGRTSVCEGGDLNEGCLAPIGIFRPQCFFVRKTQEVRSETATVLARKIFLPPSTQISTAVLVDILRRYFFSGCFAVKLSFVAALRFASSQQKTLTMTWSINCLFRPRCLFTLSYLTQVCFRKPRVILTASLMHCLLFPSPF